MIPVFIVVFIMAFLAVIPLALIAEITTIPNANEAMVSIVKYPSIKPVKNGALSYFSVTLPKDGSRLNNPVKPIKAIVSNKNGVSKLPIRSTIFAGFKLSQYTSAKRQLKKALEIHHLRSLLKMVLVPSHKLRSHRVEFP